MKKAALTFGLFSLVMVATSFTTPEIMSLNNSQPALREREGNGTGSVTGGQTKKVDLYDTNAQSVMRNGALNIEANVNQSLGLNKKQD
ncbi:hypothetical protein B4N84_05175 [Flavobacterium sp. IR1]|nr:hypothetical protein B4N84_05175 [Flavobacterium sp. IR1]